MNLNPGGRIGAYEVVHLLGAGGMGEVYRARDMRLGRDVALKVLPQAVAADPDRHEIATGGLWRAPLDGSAPTQIVKMTVRTPDLSPDGTSIAFVALDPENRPMVVACRLPLCPPDSHIRLWPDGLTVSDPEGGAVRWAPGGGSAYVKQAPQPNIWIQPLNGAPPQQLTHFSDGRAIPDFAWSRDGARLAIVRLRRTTNVVLFKSLRSKS